MPQTPLRGWDVGPDASQNLRLRGLATQKAVPRDDQGSGFVPIIAGVIREPYCC